MPEIKHTPGPWIVSPVDTVNPRIDGPDGREVANATQRDPHPAIGQGITVEQAIANAKLIAAAPDLLEALMAARDLWGDYLPPGNSKAMKAMKLVNAAIAKATQ